MLAEAVLATDTLGGMGLGFYVCKEMSDSELLVKTYVSLCAGEPSDLKIRAVATSRVTNTPKYQYSIVDTESPPTNLKEHL